MTLSPKVDAVRLSWRPRRFWRRPAETFSGGIGAPLGLPAIPAHARAKVRAQALRSSVSVAAFPGSFVCWATRLVELLDERREPHQPLRPGAVAACRVEAAGLAGIDEVGAPVGGERGDRVIGGMRIVAACDDHARPGQGRTRRGPVRAR